MKKKLLIKNGMIADCERNVLEQRDIVVEDGLIRKGGGERSPGQGVSVVDASGMIVLPGLVDMHVHLREPGREDKETIASGTRAAIRGGITTVLAMPNTEPPCDTAERVRALAERARRSAQCSVIVCGCITSGRHGEALADIGALKAAGAAAISDDGNSVDSDDLMLAALKTASAAGILVIAHSEDKVLSAKGVVNRGLISTSMGLRGISKASEYERVERDIRLAAASGARLHIAHVSCAESVELIAKAKKRGEGVTAETAPHYLCLTEEAVTGFDPNFKMNPPLRTPSDREALRQALRDGTIDAIASDHAPHTENEKEIEFERAEFGVIGLETALSVCSTELVETGVLSWPELARAMSYNPSRILSLPAGTLCPGAAADITIVDPRPRWVVQKDGIVSKSKNSPFLGREFSGVVACVIRRGELAYTDDAYKARESPRSV